MKIQHDEEIAVSREQRDKALAKELHISRQELHDIIQAAENMKNDIVGKPVNFDRVPF